MYINMLGELSGNIGVSMIVAPNGWCDQAHINEEHKNAGIMPAQKYKQDDKRLITEAS
ncbi:hypothetical protein OIU82_02785 [Escherichia coli]|nr:hypothetical protein [Escherichia coli]